MTKLYPTQQPEQKSPTPPPRPENSFFLYRKHYAPVVLRDILSNPSTRTTGTLQAQLSKRMSIRWKEEENKEYWYKLAEQAKEEHRRKYPNYVYRPNKSNPNKKTKKKGHAPLRTQAQVQAAAQSLPLPPAYGTLPHLFWSPTTGQYIWAVSHTPYAPWTAPSTPIPATSLPFSGPTAAPSSPSSGNSNSPPPVAHPTHAHSWQGSHEPTPTIATPALNCSTQPSETPAPYYQTQTNLSAPSPPPDAVPLLSEEEVIVPSKLLFNDIEAPNTPPPAGAEEAPSTSTEMELDISSTPLLRPPTPEDKDHDGDGDAMYAEMLDKYMNID
ncbi:hypothetical protein D9613_009043 [Agrocybe pediades]|uniref:HMG box domain-containing protein n=1 Tax=Agrocybe pediades TaxID=84607 RepID=A0A8H4R6J6_9AGAR|nr:hypothetical protein D9613_009043 [Agrocybe pediades]